MLTILVRRSTPNSNELEGRNEFVVAEPERSKDLGQGVHRLTVSVPVHRELRARRES